MENTKEFKCSNCDCSFALKGNLKRHMNSNKCKIRKGKNITYHCHYCDYTCNDKVVFQKHCKSYKCRGLDSNIVKSYKSSKNLYELSKQKEVEYYELWNIKRFELKELYKQVDNNNYDDLRYIIDEEQEAEKYLLKKKQEYRDVRIKHQNLYYERKSIWFNFLIQTPIKKLIKHWIVRSKMYNKCKLVF